MKKILITLSITIVSYSAYSQEWFDTHNQGDRIPGYILGMNGDTIEGFIRYDFPIVMQKRISFYASEDDTESIVYSPEDIWGYALIGKKWISITVKMDTYDGNYKFRRFGILESEQGPVKLLRIFKETDKLKKKINSEQAERELNNIYLDYPQNSLDQLYIQKVESEAELVKSKEFKKSFISRMNFYVGDHAALIKKIESKEEILATIWCLDNLIPLSYRKRIEKLVFEDIPKSNNLSEILDIKLLKGYKDYYRIRVGDYRIGCKIEKGNKIIFYRIKNRSDIYNVFP